MYATAPITIPPIGVMPDKYMPGADDPADVVPSLICGEFRTQIMHRWDDDAHFVTYYPTNNGGQANWPRCKKPILHKLRKLGVDLYTSLLVLDYDNPGHGRWQDGQQSVFLNQLQALADIWPMAWDWTLMYTTLNGARLVYALDMPLPVDQAERKHQWLCRQFELRGMGIDCAVSDWTRCFRLPFVVREIAKQPVKTWELSEPMTLMHWQESKRIKVADLGDAEPLRSQAYGDIVTYDIPKPDIDEAQDLIYTTSTSGAQAPTQWASTAKKKLEGKACYDCLYKHQPLAKPPGERAPGESGRNETLMRYVGQAVQVLGKVPTTTPIHIYGLFLDTVLQLDADDQTRDWTGVLWSMVLRVWSREEAKISGTLDLDPVQTEQRAASLMDSIYMGMKEWCKEPILTSVTAESTEHDKQKVLDWIQRRLIAINGNTFSIMGPNGWYESAQWTKGQLIPRWRIMGLDVIFPSRVPKENGKGYRDISVDALLNACATPVTEIRAVPQLRGGYIENMDTTNAALVVPCYSRNPEIEATAQYDEDVDEWLRKLGGEQYTALCQWIAWSLAWDEGRICALSMSAPPACGKQMLVQGLAECLTTPKTATAEDLTSQYQYGLLESPFLVVNEGWPKINNGLHPADQFRRIVGGDPIQINRRYMAPVHMRNPVRCLFMANNTDVIHMLTGGRDMAPGDREALSQRLMHINVKPDASVWLKYKGGMSFTGKAGHRWIANDGGKSDYVVARHFMWMYMNRGTAPGARERFLVEGGRSLDIMFEMRTRSGASPLVIETILKMIESPRLPEGVAIEGHRIYVLASYALDYFRKEMAIATRGTLTSRQVQSVLKGLIISAAEEEHAIELPSKKHLGRKMWHQLDVRLLYSVAQQDGWTTPRLDAAFAALLKYEELTATEQEVQAKREAEIESWFPPVEEPEPTHVNGLPKMNFGQMPRRI